jgi:ubiquitin carboxyl-terminal hydrolase 8
MSINTTTTAETILNYSKNGMGLSCFINVGNTCFLNSALHVLLHIPEIYKIFIKTEELLRDSELDPSVNLNFYKCFRDIYKGYWEDDCFIRPVGILKYLDAHSHFNFGEQHDSTEVLTFLIEKIHETISMSMPLLVNPSLTEMQIAANKEWSLHLDGKSSELVDLFWGQYMSRNKCLHCGSKSHKFETFHYLTLQATLDNESEPESDIHICQLFSSLLQSKRFDCENKYFCDTCNTKVDQAYSKLKLWKLPKYLIIQLKRYYNDKDSKIIKKSHRSIEYPLEFNGNFLLSKNSPQFGKSLNYKLQSGVFHLGGMMGGHYNCFTWNEDIEEWVFFDDQHSSQITELATSDTDIYQLVYRLS